MRGAQVHERVHSGDDAASRGVPVRRGLAIYSERYGLTGKADLVELRPEGPYPVEFKSGRRHGPHADVQLCAQALCLEEMYAVAVPRGAIYYHAARTRHEVQFDEGLRDQTTALIAAVRDLLREQRLPAPVADGRCRRCSLVEACLPNLIVDTARLRGLQGALYQVFGSAAEE